MVAMTIECPRVDRCWRCDHWQKEEWWWLEKHKEWMVTMRWVMVLLTQRAVGAVLVAMVEPRGWPK